MMGALYDSYTNSWNYHTIFFTLLGIRLFHYYKLYFKVRLIFKEYHELCNHSVVSIISKMIIYYFETLKIFESCHFHKLISTQTNLDKNFIKLFYSSFKTAKHDWALSLLTYLNLNTREACLWNHEGWMLFYFSYNITSSIYSISLSSFHTYYHH